MNRGVQLAIQRDGVMLAFTDYGGEGPPVLLLHGLAGSSRELLPTADALSDKFRVVLLDQRGHGASSRRPADLSRQAFVDDVIAVMQEVAPRESWTLIGQSMGAHTAFLVAAERPDLIERLVMLEGHVAGGEPEEAAALERYFASWPIPFADEGDARQFLGDDAIVDAWVADLEQCADGLRPRFDADIMRQTIEAVHEQRWSEWETLQTPTLAIFAEDGMFSDADKDELIRRRPATERVDVAGGSHDAHLDAFDAWVGALNEWLDASAVNRKTQAAD